MEDVKHQVKEILDPKVLLAAYRLKWPWPKGQVPSGTVVGKMHFYEDFALRKALYDLAFYSILEPLSKIPLEILLAIDLTEFLPSRWDPDYPAQCLGLITILDQQRIITSGYSIRYTHAFFDPVCEKLVRQLVFQPEGVSPASKTAWLTCGYSVDDWLARVLWFWAPLAHSDEFMSQDRQIMKNWLHQMRAEVELHANIRDPFTPREATDDVDIQLFKNMVIEGPPTETYDPKRSGEATISDYTFWWIRIVNSHFAIIDMCGHYPYWIRWKGQEWNKEDRKYLKKTDNFEYDPALEPLALEIRSDYLNGIWKPLQPNPEFEQDKPKEPGTKGTWYISTPAK
ncbi:hypothetical protein NA57DRAFT_72782 [Rhizodiscina lignyota]|uniref:Uncharacterized protein n=1 Tax=Rhizodiscina lignyota TaxID=1504668 RepID=A0A9P4IHU8_9PEZI|nr:hypothetical protein NA57DRAFT_72782 [Rhizodiscina lignyota]